MTVSNVGNRANGLISESSILAQFSKAMHWTLGRSALLSQPRDHPQCSRDRDVSDLGSLLAEMSARLISSKISSLRFGQFERKSSRRALEIAGFFCWMEAIMDILQNANVLGINFRLFWYFNEI